MFFVAISSYEIWFFSFARLPYIYFEIFLRKKFAVNQYNILKNKYVITRRGSTVEDIKLPKMIKLTEYQR